MHSESGRYRHDNEMIQSVRLSPELALTDTDLYKARLIHLLKTETAASGQIWKRLCERGNIDLEGVRIDPASWTGHHKRDEIIIGAQPWDSEFRSNAFFEGERFTGESEKVLILSHELSHRVLNLCEDQEVNDFFRFLIGIRKDTGKGFSSIASLPFYEGLGYEIQGAEDFAELVNKYLIDPDYLQRFFALLTDVDREPERNKYKLNAIPKEYVKPITDIIERAIVLV